MKKHPVFMTEQAVADLASIFEYVSKSRSPRAAGTLVDALEADCLALEHAPKRGRACPELKDLGESAIREIVRRPYRILYDLKDDAVYIIAVLDGRRDLREELARRLLRARPPIF
jgi:plasmid stabilization system protein ParE